MLFSLTTDRPRATTSVLGTKGVSLVVAFLDRGNRAWSDIELLSNSTIWNVALDALVNATTCSWSELGFVTSAHSKE